MQGPFINSFRLSRTFEKYKTGPIFRFSPFAFKQKNRPGLFPSGFVSTYFAGDSFLETSPRFATFTTGATPCPI